MERQAKKIIWIILGVLVCLNIIVWIWVYEISKPKFLEVIFFNVGQGDSIFIETPEKYQILIDGGPGSVILEKLKKEIPFYDKTIDLILLTHPEADHITGLIEVLKRYKVKNILWTGVEKETGVFEKWLEAIRKEGAEIIIAQAGQKIKLPSRRADVAGGEMKILNPLTDLEGQEVKNTNNTSVVIQFNLGENSFLFTGDIYKDKENELAEKYNLDSDILKISHHGSKTSTSQEFLDEVAPEIAVISCSKDNSYGHPHPEVLEKLERIHPVKSREAGISPEAKLFNRVKVLRTDLDGDIKFECDMEKCLVNTERCLINTIE